MEPTITIIIPIYNIATYLPKCFESCIQQTYHNLEILAINDGSTDNSLSIIQKYAAKDNRIKIIDKPNGGLNSVRQAGVNAATGYYLTFLDGDDYLELSAIEKMLNIIEKENSDIVVTGANVVFDKSNKLHSKIEYPALTLNNIDYTKRILTHGGHTVWGKLYKSSLVKQKTEYPNIKAGQDLPVTIQWCQYPKKVVFTPEITYNYIVAREGSTMSGDRKSYVEYGFQAFYYTFNFLINHPNIKYYHKELSRSTCTWLYNYFYHPDNKRKMNRKKIIHMRKYIISHIKHINQKQFWLFIFLLSLNFNLAHKFVFFMQKIKPTLNPYTK